MSIIIDPKIKKAEMFKGCCFYRLLSRERRRDRGGER